ncbi:MAG: ABC transporter permease subunit [Abitibacteriaceae bacterium]|nr:ABC transporter permease subunit [Abditibacteriaceae bacterium]
MQQPLQEFEFNAILKREVRARWRRWPAFVAVFLYAALLAVALGWRYTQTLSSAGGISTTDAPRMGRELFDTMTFIQALGWMLLAPVLTATAITGERERGTLSGLLLSCLTPSEIVRGKLLSAFSFIGLMLLVPLPIMAICFPLGGVSPGEFVIAVVLNAGTAVACAAVGLVASASQRRSSTAIGWALASIVLWCIVPPISLFSPLSAVMFVPTGQAIVALFLGLIFLSIVPLWMVKEAAFRILRPLPDPPPVERVSQLSVFTSPTTPYQESSNYEESLPASPMAKWQRLPLVSRLKFDNPVLQREVRIRLQMREGAWGTESQNSPGCWLTIGVFFLCFGLILVLSAPESRLITWTTFTNLWLLGVIIGTTLMGALAFAREREQGMLQPVMLTLMTRRDILAGKIGGSLVVCAYFSLALLPVLLPCLRGLWNSHGQGLDQSVFGLSLAKTENKILGISVLQALSTVAVIMVTAWFCTACGLLLSWFSRQTWIATGGALAAIFLLNVLPPLVTPVEESGFSLARFYQPFFAVQAILRSNATHGMVIAGWFTLFYFSLGLLFLFVVYAAMRNGARESESR